MKFALTLALAGVTLTAAPVFADELIADYTAYIGQADLYNSKGQRLTQGWQVLRQDRANFHKFGIRDAGDQSDPYFASVKNRELMEKMIMQGQITPGAKAILLQGDATVYVEIFGTNGIGYSVHVTVSE